MNVTLIGRGEVLLAIGKILLANGHKIAMVITAKESPEHKITNSDLKDFADAISARYLYTPNLYYSQLTDTIADGDRDIAVSANYTGILSQEIIDVFRLGVLNAHGGDLPRYKGNACQAWAIINGEERIGLCIHKMIGDKLDEGMIITREYFNLDINTRIKQVYDWMEERIPVLTADAISALENDGSYFLDDTSSYDAAASLRCYPRLPEDCKIDWSKSNMEILRLINASSEPFSGAYASFEEHRFTIWRAELVTEHENFLAVPGQIAKINVDGTVDVICGQGKIRMTEVEYKGVRTEQVSDIIKSIRKRLK